MENFRRILVSASFCLATAVLAQPTPPAPPASANVPAPAHPSGGLRPTPARVIPSPTGPIRPGSPQLLNAAGPVATTTPVVTPKEPTLVFDAESKTYDAKPGEAEAPFTFNLTNVWTNEIVIEKTQTSCGCTVAKLPSQPWHLPAGSNGQIGVTIHLAGKPPGLITKNVTVYTSVGMRMLTVKCNNPPPAPAVAMTEEQRKKNMEQAAKDRQSIFHKVGEENCASCHVDKGIGKMDKDLFDADCGICHDSPRRAQGVPDLKAIAAAKATNFDYWREWIKDGGRGASMMPAFGQEHGGPLTEAQINSIAAYLTRTLSAKPVAPVVTNAALLKK